MGKPFFDSIVILQHSPLFQTNGRFKTGQIIDVAAEGIDVYNTMIKAMGARNRLGPIDRESRYINSILA